MTATTAIIVAIIGSGGLGAIVSAIIDAIKSRNKLKLTDIDEKLNKILEDSEKTHELTIATARDRLNFLSNIYLAQGYIPIQDYVSFKLIGEAYDNAKGNSEVKARYYQAMKLPQK